VRSIVASYRLQLHGELDLVAVADLLAYLRSLGISHVYLSPILQAASGSTHGYDVVDPLRVDEALGGDAAYEALCGQLSDAGLGQILDVVPNHMAIGDPKNVAWWDVLENGPASLYAAQFDVDWDPPEAKLRNVVLLPILADHYGRVLEEGSIALLRDAGSFVIRTGEHSLPVAPRSQDEFLGRAAVRCGSNELAFIAESFGRLPHATATDHRSVVRRHRDKEVLRRQLERVCSEEPVVARAIDAEVAAWNADADLLDGLLERQNYRLAHWRAAGRDLGYRRFFDVASLVGVRVEDEQVFADTHSRILGWLKEGRVDGLRVDHVDGLRDPEGYLWRLRELAPRTWIGVEKVLIPGERLPEAWPADSTTGYDFLELMGGLFVDPEGEKPLTELYVELTGEEENFAEVERSSKAQVVREILGSELNRATAQLLAVCERHRRHRDYTRHELHEVLRELLVAWPVYRTYARDAKIGPNDVTIVNQAVERAKASRPDLESELFDFAGEVLTLRVRGDPEWEFVMRFQQLTASTMAKGVEDTAFYRFHRLVSRNEIGGDPARFSVTPQQVHEAFGETVRRHPLAMLATATHDTKRGEDTRIRISLLSEVPERWSRMVRGWYERHERFRSQKGPDAGLRYLLYQTLVGTWPAGEERVLLYLEKAAREAKLQTSWLAPNSEYEQSVRSFVRSLLGDDAFSAEIESFVGLLRKPAWIASLAQTLVKCTAPGFPDFYQGCELWDTNLVDPDNRRPVDYGLRKWLLAKAAAASAEDAWAEAPSGLPKLWLIQRALAVRRAHPGAFEPLASYRPLEATGPQADHAFSFVRGEEVATVVPRLWLGFRDEWGETEVEIPRGAWRDALSGERHVSSGAVLAAQLLRRFPVALLVREEAS
jgi:(1->4)-alpha-D-glucan 1-alpha-D-glucosylmutase